MKKLMVCADDFGQDLPISEGILSLALTKRIQATSCLVNGTHWKLATKLPTHTQVGLHFNLTQGHALSGLWKKTYGEQLPSLSKFITELCFGRIRTDCLLDELRTQWQFFCNELGRAPDFVDGHQHVHQYYVVQEVLLDFLTEHAFSGFCRTIMTNSSDILRLQSFPKRLALYLLGGGYFRQALARYKIQTNTSFQGFYPFQRSSHYRDYFRYFLSESLSGGLIMCHPGLISENKEDPLYASRGDEYRYFMSDHYLADLKEFGFE